ncbi:hypothetical protein SDC9_92716 [bioreactor metagenome]|uniref:Phospholipase C/D domain-containing protein n=1 Tax=bioreactor metagenome TaxID=1076179 RepID=A0A644ZYV4_9ZZZZ
MPSGLTHILLTKKLQDHLPDGDLKNIFAYGSVSLQVGAIAPDIPYASLFDHDIFRKQSSLADSFHYNLTNQIALRSLTLLKKMRGVVDDSIHYHIFSFYLGYISHIFADGIIHPFVRDKVGNYKENKAAHRSLEMQLDVLLIHHYNKKSGLNFELNFMNIHDELSDFTSTVDTISLIQTFSNLIYDVYNVHFANNEILEWIEGLHRMFNIAEGSFPAFARNSLLNTLFYRNYDDIDKDEILNLNKPKDRLDNFLKIENVNFIDDCLPQFFSKYIETAQKAYEFVYMDGSPLCDIEIPMINLDTGRHINNNILDEVPILWINN